MTNREYEIFSIIQNDPLISQNEIASRLGLTRSAVSVYLNNMTKKGVIKGRGYLIYEDSYPVLVGPAHVDILSRLNTEEPDDETFFYAEKTTISYGGATRHVAEYLKLLGLNPKAMMAVGSDPLGKAYIQDCEAKGIDTSCCVVAAEAKTPVYNEILSSESKRVASAYSSNLLVNHITPALIHSHYTEFSRAGSIIVHDSINSDAVDYILSNFGGANLIFFSTMLGSTQVHQHNLSRFTNIIMPLSIARGLYKDEVAASYGDITADLFQVSHIFKQKGVDSVFMPCGLNVDCHIGTDKIVYHEYTGDRANKHASYRSFRDAFAAAVNYSIITNASLEETLYFAAASKSISEQSTDFFNANYCLYLIDEARKEIHSSIKYLPL